MRDEAESLATTSVLDRASSRPGPPNRDRAAGWWLKVATATVLIALGASLGALRIIEKHTEEEIARELKALLDASNDAMHVWVNARLRGAARLTRRPDVQADVEALLEVPCDAKVLRTHPALGRLRTIFRPILAENDDQGFFVVAPDHCSIASMRDSNTGTTNLLADHGDYLEQVLAGEPQLVLPLPSDVPLPSRQGTTTDGEPTMFVAVPFRGQHHQVVAALLIRIDPSHDFTRIARIARLGRTGDAFALNEEGRLISESRFDAELRRAGLLGQFQRSVLNVELRDPGGDIAQGFAPTLSRSEQPLTYMAAQALAHKDGVHTRGYRNSLGVPVVGAWVWNDEHHFGLAIEVGVLEAKETYRDVRFTVLGLLVVLLMLFALFVVVVYGSHRRLNLEVIERRNLQSALARLATTDALTGLNNRTCFEQIYSREKERADRSGQPFSVILFDLDHFKSINDTFGHNAGDAVLREFGELIAANLRLTDFLFRWGGEELMVLSIGSDLRATEVLAQRIRQTVESHGFAVVGRITCSCGVAEFHREESAETVIARADDALYEAKERGRNQVVSLPYKGRPIRSSLRPTAGPSASLHSKSERSSWASAVGDEDSRADDRGGAGPASLK